MTAVAPTTVTGTLGSALVNAAVTSAASNTTGNAALAGLVVNLASATSVEAIKIIAEEMLRTPNVGAAFGVAEKLYQDCSIVDPVQRQLSISADISALQSIITVQTHSTGILSGILANLGL